MITPAPKLSDIAAAHLDQELGFADAVEAVVSLIPQGRVASYGQVAQLMGRPGAARQVGWTLARLEPGTLVPWWRVLRTDGRLPTGGAPQRQAARLRAEGIAIQNGRLDMARHRWRPEPV